MKIGIVTGNLDPKIGGGARFCREILHELARRGCPATDQWLILSEKPAEPGFPVPRGAGWQTLSRQAWMGKLRRPRRSALASVVARQEISMVWFVGGGGFPDPLECPFIATVWDVQHRTHPFLPEMQEKGEWEYRESKTAAFLPQAAVVITGTQEGARQLREMYGIQKDRLLLAPHPTPGFFVRTQFLPNRPASPPYFLYPANFWPHKNHATLVQALQILRKRGHNARLILTGTGRNLAHIRAMGRQLGIEEALEFRGHVSDGELAHLYDQATALTYASLSGPENLPPLEAMARGCPVLNSDFPGAREQLGEAAVFVSPTDPDRWAEGMARFLDPEVSLLRDQLLPAGARRMEARTVAKYVDQVLGWIDEFRATRSLWP